MDSCVLKSAQPPPKTSWNCPPNHVERPKEMVSDIEIARSVKGKEISELCRQIGITSYEQYGLYKAKINPQQPKPESAEKQEQGYYVVVTGVTPTSFGEGKSTTTLGLAQAFTAHLKRNSFACIRQPSQGPTFGMKGGAAGGGYSQVWPMDDFNLHLTGDIHAVTAANNLVAAAIDARMFHETTQSDDDLFRRLVNKPSKDGKPSFTEAQIRRLEKVGIPTDLEPDQLNAEQKNKFSRLNIDPDTITWQRVIDTSDRFLRKITVGQSPTEKNGSPRETRFAISVVSEIMAILALATDFNDVCRRIENMVVGYTKVTEPDELPQPVTCDDLCVAGATCALIKDAVKPTLLQTLEGTPVLVHCGPFANVAHGNSSIIADKLALDLVGPDGFVITEAGFATDVGFEKFMDIKCRYSGLKPDCAVLVTTMRALKLHGRELFDVEVSDEMAIEKGFVNLNAHIKNLRINFNVPVVVAFNRFVGDSTEELELLKHRVIEAGASASCITNNWAEGGKGAVDLAKSVIDTCARHRARGTPARLLYDDSMNLDIIQKIKLIATRVYGASNIHLPSYVLKKVRLLEANGFTKLPLCIAKTQLSISHDPKMKGAPTGYTFPIEDIDVAAGAGFVYALAGQISTMPGLPTRPAFFDITIDPVTGEVEGLF